MDSSKSFWENMPFRWQLNLWAPMILGVLYLFWLNQSWGPGASPDTANYLAAARSMAAGDSWVIMGDRPLLWWPPLFPLVWSFGIRLGLSPLLAVVLLHVLGWLAFAFAWAKLCFENLSPRWAYLCWLVLAFGLATMRLFSQALSEPGFAALIAWVCVCLIRSQKGEASKALWFAALFAAAACMWRYLGVAVVLAGGCYLLLQRHSLQRKWQQLSIWFGVSLGPLLLWLLRNWQVSGTLTGHRPPAKHGLLTQTEASLSSALHWLTHGIPWKSLPGALLLLSLLFLAGSLLWQVRSNLKRVHYSDKRAGVVVLFTGFISIYLAAFLGLSSMTFTSLANARFIAPIMAPFFLVITMILTHGLKPRSKPDPLWIAAAFWVGLFLVFGIIQGHQERGEGWGIRHRVWQTSDLIQNLRSTSPELFIYSNIRPEIYLLTGRDGAGLPQKRESLEAFAKKLGQTGGLIAWSKIPPPERKPYDFAALKQLFPSALVVTLEDGWLLRVPREL